MSDRTRLSLAAVGDIMLGDLPACSGFGVGSMIRQHGPEFPFARLGDALGGADLVCGNLEAVLSPFDPDRDPFESTHLRAQPQAVAGLRAAGFDVVNLANNHIMQHGRQAVLDTVRALHGQEIGYTGLEDAEAGLSNLAVRTVNGVRVGFLGYNFRPPQYFLAPPMDVQGSTERVLRDIGEQRTAVDRLIVSLHWGEEFVDRPSAEQVRQARAFVDAGADVVLGHHPHILQGVERYRGRVIAYSLGDFVFDLWQPRLRESMVLRLDLSDRDDIGYRIVPLRINRRWQPQPLTGDDASVARARIERLGGLVDPELPAERYAAMVASELQRFRREVHWHYLTSLHRFGVKRFAANLKGIVGRRLRRRPVAQPQTGG